MSIDSVDSNLQLTFHFIEALTNIQHNAKLQQFVLQQELQIRTNNALE